MCNKKDIIKKVYEDILKDKKTFATLKSELSLKSQLDEAFICDHILPLAKKVDPEITWQDILAYEKEALTQPQKISLTDLENISGGKASNVLLSCGLLALMGFSGLAASNVASADFIEFTKTKEYSDYNTYLSKGDDASTEEREKYEFVTLGEVPFYLQADHMVDGLLWFRSPDEDKAFFVMDRKFENKNAVYTYSAEEPSQLNLAEKSINKPPFEELQKQEFKLFNISELTEYLKESFNDAKTTSFENPQTIQLADDNPLYNFSRFYNPQYLFNLDSKRQNLEEIPMYAKNKNGIFKTIDFDPEIKNEETTKKAYAEKLAKHLKEKVSWNIAHRTLSADDPTFKSIESSKVLNSQLGVTKGNTGAEDKEVLRNDGFTFFTLQVGEKKTLPGNMFEKEQEKKLFEKVLDFKNIPVVSCSKDMLARLNPETSSGEENLFGLFYQEDDQLPPAYPCFNGSAEEVKNQIAIYYINKLYDSLENKDDFNENNRDSHVEAIKNMIHNDELEVRIPTHVAVDKWEKVKLK